MLRARHQLGSRASWTWEHPIPGSIRTPYNLGASQIFKKSRSQSIPCLGAPWILNVAQRPSPQGIPALGASRTLKHPRPESIPSAPRCCTQSLPSALGTYTCVAPVPCWGWDRPGAAQVGSGFAAGTPAWSGSPGRPQPHRALPKEEKQW